MPAIASQTMLILVPWAAGSKQEQSCLLSHHPGSQGTYQMLQLQAYFAKDTSPV